MIFFGGLFFFPKENAGRVNLEKMGHRGSGGTRRNRGKRNCSLNRFITKNV